MAVAGTVAAGMQEVIAVGTWVGGTTLVEGTITVEVDTLTEEADIITVAGDTEGSADFTVELVGSATMAGIPVMDMEITAMVMDFTPLSRFTVSPSIRLPSTVSR